MRKLITALFVAILGWQGYNAYHRASLAAEEPMRWSGDEVSDRADDALSVGARDGAATESSRFSCDGRIHCSQMTSCAEATWFITHCPGTEMDGDNDGVPCERQWCER